MADIKISIIGAGSAIFSIRLVGDLCRTKEFHGSHVTLMDIDRERLDAVYNLATRYAKALGSKLHFEKTDDLERAIEGSDFVINTALVGGHAEQAIMREVGERNGYYRGIDATEFNFVSDYFTLTNTRQFDYFLEIARKMEKVVPKAELLLAANPVFEGTNLISRMSGIKVTGFCHGHHDVRLVAEAVGVELEDVDWQVAGFNHNIWLTRFRKGKENLYGRLDRWIEREIENWQAKDPFDLQLSPGAIDMYKFYGRMPIGDSVRNGSWKYNYDPATKRRWFGHPWGGVDTKEGWQWYQERLRESTERTFKLAGDESADLLKEFPPEEMSGEQHVQYIDALVNNKKTRLVLNIPNYDNSRKERIIPDFPENVYVEVPVTVDGNGVLPEVIDPQIPEKIVKMYLFPRWLRMEWALDAYISGDISVFKEILVRDRRTDSEAQIERLVVELAEANPAFAKRYGL